MRTVPRDISDKLALEKQTRAENANPSSKVWISRPSTPLVMNAFLERQTILTDNITDASIAVCHPRLGRENTTLYLAYINHGIARVATAVSKVKMDSHEWTDTGFAQRATAVSIVFDGTMPTDADGVVELVTDSIPWIFWCTTSGTCYCKKLGNSSASTVLATSNCTAVSAVRASWSSINGFDFGLCVFMILNGSIYYRQLINGVWYDAELVSFTPPDSTEELPRTWVDVRATRTWDYRVVLQLKSSSGAVYELFSEYGGIGGRTQDHLELSNISANAVSTSIDYSSSTTDNGHIEIPNMSAAASLQSFDDTPDELAGYSTDRIELSSVAATGAMTAISFTNFAQDNGHLELAAITATGALTHIDDI